MGSKWDMCTGCNDFSLWKVKMREILIQQKCVEALKGEAHMPAHLSAAEKTEMNDKAVSAIILCLGDKCLKQQLYFYRMVETKSIME
ncbi:glutamate receptor 3.6 [Trifolium medium]|uniref:Glutamate receptor 3.6 n=1 Tax=Trifolium medium TaxID=97028 RepID=A0A392N660_9FABA|nr:glutamate receptor 3.6 [Trifolium medium]